MNKYINIPLTSQEFSQRKAFILKKIDSFPQHKRKFLFEVLSMSYQHQQVTPTLMTLAKKCGFSHKTAWRYMKEFQKLGLLHITYRHLRSSLYRVEQVFYDCDFRTLLEQLYNFKFSIVRFVLFNASLLLSFTIQSEYVQDINPQIYYNKLLAKFNLERVNLTHARARGFEHAPGKSAAFRKKVKNMLPFDDDEIKSLSIYPKATRDYAHRRLTKEIASGKAITNHYAYFVGICKTHVVQASTAKPTVTNNPKRDVMKQRSELRSSKPIEYAKPSLESLQQLYELRLNVYKKGLQWFGYDAAELEKIASGFKPGTKLSAFDCAPRPPEAAPTRGGI